ncbi:MAG: MATE family efflux transporter [Bacteroidales bacterium]|nr:MAG: MATE family efflux transporter [Bacteroidales bacterium]
MRHNRFNQYFLSIKNVIKEISDAIKGTEVDYTSISLRKALILLSIPMVLEMSMESIFTIVDIYFVSKLGSDATSIVGLTESLLTLIYAFGIGFAISATAIVSRRIGEKEPRKAANAAFQGILVAGVVSLLISAIGILFSDSLLRVMGASDEAITNHGGYTKLMLGGNMTIMFLFILNGIYRGAGDAAIALRVLIISNLINIILDPMLIFGIGPFPELGVTGAAVATNIGRGIGVTIQLYTLFSGSSRIRLFLKDLKPDLSQIVSYLKLSSAGIFQLIIGTTSWVAMVRIISEFGSVAVAGYTIGIRVIIFAILPSSGLSNAAATLVGQNLGAGKPKQAERSVWSTGIANSIFLGIIGLVLVIWPESVIRLLVQQADVVEKSVECLRIVSIGFISYGFGMVLVNSLNGAGDTLTPMYINIFCFWLLEIPLAYLLAIKFGMQERGVYYAIVVAETTMTLTALLFFIRGKWKLKKV